MDTVERGAISNEKDAHRNDGDAELGLERKKNFDASTTSKSGHGAWCSLPDLVADFT
jgi:hypothetical protein